MKWLPLALIFVAGISLGLLMKSGVAGALLAAVEGVVSGLLRIVTAPFRFLKWLFSRRKMEVDLVTDIPYEHTPPTTIEVDPREQQISDSAQTIRNILMSLAAVIQQTDDAANTSNLTLGDMRKTIDRAETSQELLAAHSLLLQEVDRMLEHNSSLRLELACSREILASQRQQIETLRTAAKVDGLTQLANRTAYDDKLSEMMANFERYREPFSLMLVDIDKFKDINDTFGHQGGDRILKGVAYKLRSLARDHDFVSRCGGDEFALILPRTILSVAADVAWKLCYGVRDSSFILDGKKVSVTISVGVAEHRGDETEESLKDRADRAMYRVKETGRNRVAMADKESG